MPIEFDENEVAVEPKHKVKAKTEIDVVHQSSMERFILWCKSAFANQEQETWFDRPSFGPLNNRNAVWATMTAVALAVGAIVLIESSRKPSSPTVQREKRIPPPPGPRARTQKLEVRRLPLIKEHSSVLLERCRRSLLILDPLGNHYNQQEQQETGLDNKYLMGFTPDLEVLRRYFSRLLSLSNTIEKFEKENSNYRDIVGIHGFRGFLRTPHFRSLPDYMQKTYLDFKKTYDDFIKLYPSVVHILQRKALSLTKGKQSLHERNKEKPQVKEIKRAPGNKHPAQYTLVFDKAPKKSLWFNVSYLLRTEDDASDSGDSLGIMHELKPGQTELKLRTNFSNVYANARIVRISVWPLTSSKAATKLLDAVGQRIFNNHFSRKLPGETDIYNFPPIIVPPED